METSSVAIIIPALNESATISKIVNLVKVYGMPIVIDDGSTDKTAELALNAGATVISHKVNQGYEAALNSGFKKAAEMGFKVILTIDADGQHDPSLIGKFLKEIDTGKDVVLGVRNKYQRVAEKIFALYTQDKFGVRDPLCGMKAYKTHVYETLGHFDSYKSVGTELALFAAKNKKFKIGEIHFIVKDRVGVSRFGTALKGNYRILRAMFYSFVRI